MLKGRIMTFLPNNSQASCLALILGQSFLGELRQMKYEGIQVAFFNFQGNI